MKWKLYIDDNDAFLEYGVFVERYGYKNLIQTPQFKSIDSTEWPEYDGIEVDLSAPVLNTKTFSMQFCITDVSSAGDMFELLSDGAYHVFRFVELGKSYRLRLTSNGSFKSKIKLGKLAVSFADDFPEIPEIAPYADGVSGVKQDEYELDDINFSRFGVYVLDGTDDSIAKAPNVRSNLTVNIKSIAGASYDSEEVTYKSKDVTMKLLIHADNISEFWRRWNSLFWALLQPELRRLYSINNVEEYDCYYKNNSVTKFDILRNGRVWCEFNLVLTFVNSRPNSNVMLLAMEDDSLVITETDESNIIIRI